MNRLQIDEDRLSYDFAYYASHLLWVDTKSEGLQPFRFNAIQKLLWYGRPKDYETNPIYRHAVIPERSARDCVLHGDPLRWVVLKYRQGGMSTWSCGFCFYRILTDFSKNAKILAHDEKTSRHLLDICKLFYKHLPAAFRPEVTTDNAAQLVFDSKMQRGLGSSISIETAGYKKAGHGRTHHLLVLSEIARYPEAESVVDGLIETVPKGLDQTGTAIIYESTAELSSDYFHTVYQIAREGQSGYDAWFLPWYLHDRYLLRERPFHFEMTPELKEMQHEYGLSDQQVWWYWDAVRQEDLKHPGMGEKMIRRQYPGNENEAFLTAGYSVYPDKAMDYLERHTVKPLAEGEVRGRKVDPEGGGRLKIWEYPQEGMTAVIGVDVAEGIGRTQSAIEVFVYPGYRQVAEWASEFIEPGALAYVVKAIAEYYQEAIVAVEVNNKGALTNSMLDSMYSNLYRWKYFNRMTPLRTGQTGWNTTPDTKVIMVQHMCSLLRRQPPGVLIRSAGLVSQMKTYLDYGGDRYQPAPGARGDMNIAALIACICLWQEYGKYDIEGFFGPEPGAEPPRKRKTKGAWNTDDWDPADRGADTNHWLML